MKRRLVIGLAIVCLGLVVGTYASGALTLALLFGWRPPVSPGWFTFWDYYLAVPNADVARFAGRIRLAGAGGYGAAFSLCALALWKVLRPPPRALHGDARFARRAEVRRAGLLAEDPFGIVIGRVRGRLLRLGGERHVILAAPTRSGKTAGVAIPVLLTYAGSVVALDIKGELHAITSGWRSSSGHAIRVWAPYAEDGRGHRFNPMQCVSTDPHLRASQIQSIAASLYPDDPSKDPFWSHQARNAFFGYASFLYEQWDADLAELARRGVSRDRWPDANASPRFPSFARVLHLSTGVGDGQPPKVRLQAMVAQPFASADTRASLSGLAGQADETLASIIGSMQEPLTQFLDPILAQATNACDFTLADLRRRPTTVYVVVPPNKLAEARKLLNVFFSMVVGENTRKSLREDPSLVVPCLLLMDEFAAMGRVDVLASSISHIAGYGLRSLPIIQGLSQLDAVYGPELARTFRTNHGASVVFTPREQDDADECSRMLGDTTVRTRRRSTSRGRGRGSMPGRNVTWSESEERRPLLLPQEVKALDTGKEIIFLEGLAYPILATKIRYFRDRFFKRRLFPESPLPSMAPTPAMRAPVVVVSERARRALAMPARVYR